MANYESSLTWVRPSERGFVHRIEDWILRVQQEGVWYLTDFLSPREQHLLDLTLRDTGLVREWHGGYEAAERRRCLLMPDQWYPAPEDYQLLQVCAEAPPGSVLSHGSVLGSLLGTGMDRRKLGDIYVRENHAYFWLCKDMFGYVSGQFHAVGKLSVTVSVGEDPVPFLSPEYIRDLISVQSLRADAVVAHACKWSRSDTQQAIQRGLVSMNFSELKRVDEEVAEGDVFSVRGYGRVMVYQVMGQNKSGKFRVEVGLLRSKHR